HQKRREGDDDIAALPDGRQRGRGAVQLIVDPLHRLAHLLVMGLTLADQTCRRAILRGGRGDDGGDGGGGEKDVLQRNCSCWLSRISIAPGRRTASGGGHGG